MSNAIRAGADGEPPSSDAASSSRHGTPRVRLPQRDPVSALLGTGTLGAAAKRIAIRGLRALEALGYEFTKREGTYTLRRALRLGENPWDDARRILGRLETVLDVGANRGQTALTLSSSFPAAAIHSFEPDPETFRLLVANTARLGHVRAYNLAVGRSPGAGTLFRNKFDETSSLLPTAAHAEDYVVDPGFMERVGTATVALTTVDDFCRQCKIERIDILKSDTQGYEIEVLAGAEQMMANVAISLLYIEVCFVRYYEKQPLFPEVYTYLYERGYRLVGIYESGFLTHFYHVGGNALFVHESLGARPRGKTVFEFGRFAFRDG